MNSVVTNTLCHNVVLVKKGQCGYTQLKQSCGPCSFVFFTFFCRAVSAVKSKEVFILYLSLACVYRSTGQALQGNWYKLNYGNNTIAVLEVSALGSRSEKSGQISYWQAMSFYVFISIWGERKIMNLCPWWLKKEACGLKFVCISFVTIYETF